MGNDDLFKKRREARKKREFAFKTPKANSFLIVTEGICTEPHYFNGYKKNYKDIYDMLDSFGGVETAISNAKRRMADFDPNKVKPSKFAPGTKVYCLVEKLREYLIQDVEQ